MGPLWSLVDSDVFKLIVALQAGLALLLSMRVLLSAFGCRVPGGFLAEPFFRQFIVRIFEITMWLGGRGTSSSARSRGSRSAASPWGSAGS